MKLLSRLFVALGAFLIVTGIIYGVHAREYEGLTLSMTVAGGALLVGGYGLSLVRRVVHAPGGPAAGPAGADEPHVGPTIWPLVFAISMIGLVIGAVSNRWVLLPGAVFFLLASVGWVLDVHRQWHHHAAAGHSEQDAAHGGAANAGAGAAAGATQEVVDGHG